MSNAQRAASDATNVELYGSAAWWVLSAAHYLHGSTPVWLAEPQTQAAAL
jgi:hypothetical protein